ncbi:MAG: SAM-dependent methyltransferase [Bacteroidales bacterium]|jgi:16S rRNA (cytidine1402-2'-O)-methyltransferase|nr:SAM-dependent methyltransferase [Bacteroidales bacterium]MCK9498732.1 SAM-dependent methyltransferase [Bacteroidales bacterium]MDY0313795.1 SAM-dependent methyltransferase [Bacteroidales bacterium]NLB85850.1 SAM-dependent methyltransferase [Bacteroidales bacterium]
MDFKSCLYLIPNLIGETQLEDVLPNNLYSKISHIQDFIVEDIRNARRFLRKLSKDFVIDGLNFYELNKHTNLNQIEDYLSVADRNLDIALLSEAGLPCIADPGNLIVQLAHKKNIKVKPLSGPSSIFMALMASGMNGQNFAFNGYLPIDKSQRFLKIKSLEARSRKENQSQIFMDTPFRNDKLLADLLSNLNSETYLCVASNISCEDELIIRKKVIDWKKINISLNKKPCIFII